MNYSQILKSMGLGRKETVSVPFFIPNLTPGQIYEGDLTFKLVSMDSNGMNIEILGLSKDGQNDNKAEESHIHQVVPSP